MRQQIKKIVYGSMTRLMADQEGLVQLKVRKGAAKGLQLKLDLVHRGESAYWLGKYDDRILGYLADVVQPGWNCWDCGVYIGLYSCFLGRQVGPTGKVHGFEPDVSNLKRARENARINGLDHVEFHNYAIAENGESDFVLSNNTNSHLSDAWLGSTRAEYATIERKDELIKIKCLALDEIGAQLSLPDPDLIKLDIEGAEKIALLHMDRLVTERRPKILLELHNPECDETAWQFAQRYDYKLFSLDYFKPVTSRADTRGTLFCDPI